MISRIVECTLWGGAILVGAATLLAWRQSLPRPVEQAPVIWSLPHEPGRAEPESLSVAAELVTEADPFRLDRRPADVPYGAIVDGAAATPPAPTLTNPNLALSGIIGGPPWVAVIDGVPGHDGSVLLHVGDTLGGLRVRAISGTTVTITGSDTTWKLTLKRPWP